MDEFDFGAIGLELRDKKVYEALYRLEKASLRSIAEATSLNRGTVYEVVKKLTKLGLATFVQSGERRHYVAADPEAFLSLIHEQRERLQQSELAAIEYTKSLESRIEIPGAGYFARFYEGDEGVASILRDVLQTLRTAEHKEYCVFSSHRISAFLYNNFKNFSRQRIVEGIFVRVIADVLPRKRLVLAERRLLAPGQQTLNGYTLLYGDKTALISISDTNVLSAVVVTDPGVTNMQRLVFERLWQNLPS
jgi:sugar-specific transcriptional regulator TrmB